MAIDPNMLAILAMDSYNRGYGKGLGLDQPSIGNATFLMQSSILAGSPEVTAGFYAVAYEISGEVVISYRGTDDPLDDWTSWTTINDYAGQSSCHSPTRQEARPV